MKERLTKRKSLIACEKCLNSDYEKLCTICDEADEAIERLAELEDKIENGTLIELPCEVGEVIYAVSFIKDKIIEDMVTGFEFNGTSLWIKTAMGYCNCHSSRIGNTIFFTHAEAEKRLNELKGERK